MRFRAEIIRRLAGTKGNRETVWSIRYWWPARRGQQRKSKVDPKTFREKRRAERRGREMLSALEDHAAGRGPDPFHEVDDRLDQWLADFMEDLAAGALSNKRRRGKPADSHVARQRKRLDLLFEEWGLERLPDLVELGPTINRRLDQLQRELAARAAAAGRMRGWGDKTRDEHGHVLVQFANWLVRRRALYENPFVDWVRVETDASQTFFRRELTIEEVQRLMDAASEAGDPLRAALWAFAAVTGWREGQIASMTWADVRGLGTDEVDVRVDAGRTKAKREDWMPLPAWLGKMLLEFRRVPLTLPVFPGFDWRNITRLLLPDAEAAGLGKVERVRRQNEKGGWAHWLRWIDPRGEKWRLDFHGFRHTCASLLDRPDVGDRDWQDLVGHADASMTRRYRHADARRQREIINSVPELMCTTCARYTSRGESRGTTENAQRGKRSAQPRSSKDARTG
jgi:integrase